MIIFALPKVLRSFARTADEIVGKMAKPLEQPIWIATETTKTQIQLLRLKHLRWAVKRLRHRAEKFRLECERLDRRTVYGDEWYDDVLATARNKERIIRNITQKKPTPRIPC